MTLTFEQFMTDLELIREVFGQEECEKVWLDKSLAYLASYSDVCQYAAGGRWDQRSAGEATIGYWVRNIVIPLWEKEHANRRAV